MWLTIKSINYVITFKEWELVNETVCNDGCAHRNVNCLFLREENTFSRITKVHNVIGSLSRNTSLDFTSVQRTSLVRTSSST